MKLNYEKLMMKISMIFSALKDERFVAVVEKHPVVFIGTVGEVVEETQRMLAESFEHIDGKKPELENTILDLYSKLDTFTFDLEDAKRSIKELDNLFRLSLRHANFVLRFVELTETEDDGGL